MRLGEIFIKGAGIFVGVIASCGPSQLYGLIKGAVELIKVAHSSHQIKKIDRQMQNLSTKRPEEREALKLTEELRNKIAEQNKKDRSELKHAGLALVPVVGAILAVKYKDYSVGPLAPLASTAEDIVEVAKPDGIPRVLFPGAQAPDKNSWACLRWEGIDGKFMRLPVKMEKGKTRTIDAIWVPGNGCKESDRTVVLYHGNAMNMVGMYDRALPYIQAGYNVLVTTIGGKQYGQIDPQDPLNAKFETNELSMYADVDAEFAFLKEKGVKDVGVHGLSIGGTKAFQAASKHGDMVKFVVAEQTLTSAGDVASNTANNMAGAENIGRVLGNQAAPLGKYDGANGNRSDGFNNKAKARKMKAELIAIAAKEDMLMGKQKRGKVYERNFAETLMQARYKDNKDQQKPLWIEGGHSANIDETTFGKIIDFANKACPAPKA
ncbi:MAG: alpha/beta hydrolase [Verrucomicrobia bacterium]|nr:alpha/beta hydrolase [Verrucomicrobiota bacterium]